MDIDSRLVLRATGRQWREFVDIRLADHVLIVQPNLQMNHGHPFVQITTPQRRPEWYWGIPFPGWLDEVWSWRTKEILKTARIVDVDCPAAADEVLKSLRSAVPTVQILRLKAARTACSPPAFVPSTVVFPSLDRSPGREYALPSRTVVFATEYDPAAPAHLLSTWLHFAHLNSMTLIFTPNGVGPVDNGVKPPGFLLDPLVRLLLANIRETDFTLVGVTDMPCGWFAIDTKGDGDGDGDGDEGREDKDAEQRSDAHRISAQIYERLSLVVCNEYDDDSVTRHGKLTRIVAGLKYFSLEEYKGHVGEEVFALHTVPWPSVKADKAADVLRLVKKAPRMYVDTPPASTSAGADADASNGTADLPVHAQEQ
jgi:hypothetical protein